MATETVPTSLQTGTTSDPISLNAQDFSGSADEILDNFADGDNPNDDGTPMGLGGEKGKQSEPASSTLEADIVNGATKQPGDKPLPEKPAGELEPVPEAAGEEGSEIIPESEEEPETPEFPPALLQMAGYADAKAAQAAGFQNPEALFSAIKWRSQLMTPSAQPAKSSEQGLYRRPAQPPAAPSPEATVETKEPGEIKPFQLPAEKLAVLDEDLQVLLREMNQHYQQQVTEIHDSLSKRDADLAKRDAELAHRQEQDESMRFDEIVRNLGEDWRDVFGEGTGMELSHAGQSDPVAMTNFNHRALLFDTVGAVREVNDKQGYKPMTLEQEVQWALMQRYPDRFQQIISKNSNGKPSKRDGVTASRPTQRRNPPKNRDAKVLSDVNAMLKKKGSATLDMGREDEFDGEI